MGGGKSIGGGGGGADLQVTKLIPFAADETFSLYHFRKQHIMDLEL